MGTRADFYVGRGKDAEWLGSIAWDGYPEGVPDSIRGAESEAEFRQAVNTTLTSRSDGTTPDMGWPWPWENSYLTDYSYAWDETQVWTSCFSSQWWPAMRKHPDELDEGVAEFPDMRDRKNVTLGKRSGLLIMNSKGVETNGS